MVIDDLMAALRAIKSVGAVFDTEMPENHTVGTAPTLSVHHISGTPGTTIGGDVYAVSERWQISVRASNLAGVRGGVNAVIDALHGFESESIKRCDWESSPGTMRESTNPPVYHAPVDFMIFAN